MKIETRNVDEYCNLIVGCEQCAFYDKETEGCAIRMDDLEERYRKAMKELKRLRT